jgi:hypothetical protein
VKRIIAFLLIPLFLLVWPPRVTAGFFDDLLDHVAGSKEPDEDTLAAGLREALEIGTRNAVNSVSREDGYFGNLSIRIPVPEELNKTEKLLRKVGMGDRVDEFILGMNRAAEAAAPQALDIFVKAVAGMTVVDAYGIVKGGQTAGTEYFREKTADDLTELFRPVIRDSMARVGAVKSYRRMMAKYNSLPLVKKVDVDLEGYVTEKSLDGLFFTVGEEEKKIRQDPAARVTELLRKVFGE